MDYIIFDLEFNQPLGKKNKKEDSTYQKCPLEIIQIGAVKMDASHKPLSTFDALVQPSIYKEVHPFIEKITNITTRQLLDAAPFLIVFKDLVTFIESKDNILCVWGMADITELFRNVSFHKLNNHLIPRRYINLQDHVSKHFRTPRGKNIGLQTAIKLMNISQDKPLHDAFNDAYYTAEIFKKISAESITPQTYDPNQADIPNKSRTKRPKKIFDAEGLVKQFEKMYKREMSQEEISIILLAYKMGQTHQFQKEI